VLGIRRFASKCAKVTKQARSARHNAGARAGRQAARLRGMARPRPLAALAALPAAACTQRAFSTALRARWAHNAACTRGLPTAPGSERCARHTTVWHWHGAHTCVCIPPWGKTIQVSAAARALPLPRSPSAVALHSFCCGSGLLLLRPLSPGAAKVDGRGGNTSCCCGHALLLRSCTPGVATPRQRRWCQHCQYYAHLARRYHPSRLEQPALRCLPACAAGGPR